MSTAPTTHHPVIYRSVGPLPQDGVPSGPQGLLAYPSPKFADDPGLLRCSTPGCSTTHRIEPGAARPEGWRTKANGWERPLRLLPYTVLVSCPACPPVCPDPADVVRALRDAPLRPSTEPTAESAPDPVNASG